MFWSLMTSEDTGKYFGQFLSVLGDILTFLLVGFEENGSPFGEFFAEILHFRANISLCHQTGPAQIGNYRVLWSGN